MKMQTRAVLSQLEADAEELDATPRRSQVVDLGDKLQKMRTPEGKAIKADNAQYRRPDGKRKFSK